VWPRDCLVNWGLGLLNPRSLVGWLLILTALGLTYWQVAVRLVQAWVEDGNYSHGFLIVPLAVYFAWERRERLKAAPIRGSWLGLAIIAASLLVLIAGLLGAELFLTRVSLVGTASGIVVYLFGWQHARILVFPLAFLLLMVPIPAIIFNQIAFPLQLFASRVGEAAISGVGIPVLREGNVLHLANKTLEVAEACSGIRSLVSLITLGIVYGYFMDQRFWVRALIVGSAVPVAILANGARVAGTGMAAHWLGPEAAEGFFHEFSGWIVFVFAFAMILVIQKVISKVAPLNRAENGGPSLTSSEARGIS
jgi:exosortase